MPACVKVHILQIGEAKYSLAKRTIHTENK